MIVYFTGNDFAEAYGYGIYYSGVVGLGAERSEDVKYSIGGTINWMEDKIDNAGTPYLSMNVFFGYDRYGNAASAIVQVRDPVLMETCKRMLATAGKPSLECLVQMRKALSVRRPQQKNL